MKRSRSRRLVAALQVLAETLGEPWIELRGRRKRRSRALPPQNAASPTAHRVLHAKIMDVVRREARRESRLRTS